MALILVVFMIALASAILFSLTDSTYVAMRLNGAAEQRIKAEYILKSAVNVAQVLLKNDTTDFDDPTLDAWMAFSEGQEVPGALLGISEPNIRVSLLITSTNGKVPIRQIYSSGQVDPTWKMIVLRLFQNLGFDSPDPMNEAEDGSLLPQSKELVAYLIDYLDTDTESFPGDAVLPQGIEGDLPNGQTFRNSGTIDSLSNELPAIPGFSPARIQRLLRFATKAPLMDINVNAAPPEVLAAVLTDPNAAASVEGCRDPSKDGPIRNPQDELFDRCGVSDPNTTKFRGQGDRYDVIAKVEYGTAMFMASAELKTNRGRLPKIESFQMY